MFEFRIKEMLPTSDISKTYEYMEMNPFYWIKASDEYFKGYSYGKYGIYFDSNGNKSY